MNDKRDDTSAAALKFHTITAKDAPSPRPVPKHRVIASDNPIMQIKTSYPKPLFSSRIAFKRSVRIDFVINKSHLLCELDDKEGGNDGVADNIQVRSEG